MNIKAIAIAGAATMATLSLTPSTAAASVGDDDIGTYSATGCTGTTCIYVNGSGLTVKYATVTNRYGNPIGRGMISSTYDGRTWTGRVLHKNEAWRHDYNRIMNDGNKVCGSIEGIDVACVTIKR